MGKKGTLRCIYSSEMIASRVKALARDIDRIYGQKPLVAICVLKGAFIFFADLVRNIHNPNLEVDFVRLASYGMNSVSSGRVSLSKDIETDIRDKNVIIVEDIVDSGHTMRFLLEQLACRRPKTLAVAALVDKAERREEDIKVSFAGFNLHAGFVVGFGMDYAERFRGLPEICEFLELPGLEPENG